MKRFTLILLLGLSALCYAAGTATAAAMPSETVPVLKKKTETVVFQTTIHCKNCVKKINDNIAFEKGVKDLKVDLEKKQVSITYDPSKTSVEKLAAAIARLGYKAEKL